MNSSGSIYIVRPVAVWLRKRVRAAWRTRVADGSWELLRVSVGDNLTRLSKMRLLNGPGTDSMLCANSELCSFSDGCADLLVPLLEEDLGEPGVSCIEASDGWRLSPIFRRRDISKPLGPV